MLWSAVVEDRRARPGRLLGSAHARGRPRRHRREQAIQLRDGSGPSEARRCASHQGRPAETHASGPAADPLQRRGQAPRQPPRSARPRLQRTSMDLDPRRRPGAHGARSPDGMPVVNRPGARLTGAVRSRPGPRRVRRTIRPTATRRTETCPGRSIPRAVPTRRAQGRTTDLDPRCDRMVLLPRRRLAPVSAGDRRSRHRRSSSEAMSSAKPERRGRPAGSRAHFPSLSERGCPRC